METAPTPDASEQLRERYLDQYGTIAASHLALTSEILKAASNGHDPHEVLKEFKVTGTPPVFRPPGDAEHLNLLLGSADGSTIQDNRRTVGLMHADLINPLGLGMVGYLPSSGPSVAHIPPAVFELPWSEKLIQDTRHAAAVFIVAETLWQRCHFKAQQLGALAGPWAELSAGRNEAIAQLKADPNVAKFLSSGADLLAEIKGRVEAEKLRRESVRPPDWDTRLPAREPTPVAVDISPFDGAVDSQAADLPSEAEVDRIRAPSPPAEPKRTGRTPTVRAARPAPVYIPSPEELELNRLVSELQETDPDIRSKAIDRVLRDADPSHPTLGGRWGRAIQLCRNIEEGFARVDELDSILDSSSDGQELERAKRELTAISQDRRSPYPVKAAAGSILSDMAERGHFKPFTLEEVETVSRKRRDSSEQIRDALLNARTWGHWATVTFFDGTSATGAVLMGTPDSAKFKIIDPGKLFSGEFAVEDVKQVKLLRILDQGYGPDDDGELEGDPD